MTLFKNGIGRPSNETIKKRNVFKIICGLLVLIILGLVIYILNDKGVINLSDKDKKSSKENIITTKPKEESEELSDEEGRKIVESVFGKFTQFSSNLNDEHVKTRAAIFNVESGTTKYSCKELFGNNLKKIDEQIWQVEGMSCMDEQQTLYEYSRVNQQYKKMFGNEHDALKETIYESDGFSSAYAYSNLKNGYSSISCECGDVFIYIDGFKNARKAGNKVYVEYAFLEADGDYFVFNDGSKIDAQQVFDSKDIWEKVKDLIDTKYTLIFEQQSDQTYIFKEAK